MRKLKYPKKTFREYNIRARGLGKPEITFEEYMQLTTKVKTDFGGKPHPKIGLSEERMVQEFGERIYTERKICIKCGCTKPVADFICRYKTKRIENICKACEKKRKRILYAKKNKPNR